MMAVMLRNAVECYVCVDRNCSTPLEWPLRDEAGNLLDVTTAGLIQDRDERLADLSSLSHAQKEALIDALWAQVQALRAPVEVLTSEVRRLRARVAGLEAKHGQPPKTPDNSSLPRSQGKQPDRGDKVPPSGPRQGSLGRNGGGRFLAEVPDETVTACPSRCAHRGTALGQADLSLLARHDQIDLPKVRPVVTRAERFAGQCRRCGHTTTAPLPEGLAMGTPFSPNIIALAIEPRFVHPISDRRLSRLLRELFGLATSGGAIDAAFQRAHPHFDPALSAILARLRRARIVCADATGVRIDGRGAWNRVFQNRAPIAQARWGPEDDVVIHVLRRGRGRGVVSEVMQGHRPAIWVSDLYGAQRGHAEAWQRCLAHQLRDCRYTIEAGDTIFAPAMKALLLRAVVLARRHRTLADRTRREYRRRLDAASMP
jgi:transposase